MSDIGITTFLVLIMILIRLPEVSALLVKEKLLLSLITFVVFISCVTLFHLDKTSNNVWAYKKIFSMIIYILFAASVISMDWTETKIFTIAKYVAIGLFLISFLVIIDSAGIINIPRINEYFTTSMPAPYAQWGHRWLMALYLAVFLPFLLIIMESNFTSKSFKLLFIIVCLYYFYFLIFSRSRSGPGSILIALFIYYIFNRNNKNRLISKHIPDFIIPCILGIILSVFLHFSDMQNYTHRIVSSAPFQAVIPYAENVKIFLEENANVDNSMTAERAEDTYNNDILRLNIAKKTFLSLKTDPLGKGFMHDPHVFFIIELIYAGGIVAILGLSLFISYFIYFSFKTIQYVNDKTIYWALNASIISWFFVGVMYNALYMSIFWAFIGIIISLSKFKSNINSNRAEV